MRQWWPSEEEYSPGIDKDLWVQLLKNPEVFIPDSLVIMERFLDIGGEATCTQLSEKYGESANYYNAGSSMLGRRIWKATGCNVLGPEHNDNAKWWPILYVGKHADKRVAGSYIWKLRPELKAALEALSGMRYTKKDFLKEVYVSGEDYNSLALLLEHKRNVILQGAPGVGKTFAAKRLAYSILGEKDESRIKFVQFHQSYSYEDFVMGYKFNGTEFELQLGVFYQFCQQAENHPDEKYIFIIDEINRGNPSKIFGELLMLIEKEYRGEEIAMAYGGQVFSIPKNLYIIGMMNTADRSLAMIDYALRRRFSFYEMRPAFESEGFVAYRRALNSDVFNRLIEAVKDLNREISNDPALGEGFCVGHSYFCGQSECTDEWISEVIEYDLVPLLNEYWFDDKARVQEWTTRLRGVLSD